jgi:mannose-6-phosphate isomerase-like protein (cupin superfamily)
MYPAHSVCEGSAQQHVPNPREVIMDIQNADRVAAFITKDGSEIRELLAHRNSCLRNQTLAEARLPPGRSTTPHRHMKTEEVYYVLQGQALMRVGQQSRPVGPGDAIAIPPGASHQISNAGDVVLRFLCCCAPGYEHEDTVLEE